MLVNRALAREFWGRDDVIGESLPDIFARRRQLQIVGVLADLSYEHPDANVEPMMFMTSGIDSSRGLAIIESPMKSAELRQAIQGLIDSGALELTILEIATLDALRGATIASDRARSALTVAAAGLVVLLAGVGFYGTQRYLVMAGRREYAIRASLGAGPGALGRLVLWRGLMLGLPGLVFGLPLAFIVVAWLRNDYLSQDISPFAMMVAAAAGLTALMLGASLGPARQARRMQPAPLLKAD
jgi:ABC-type antimicrobial peptide transport system permease subunit